MLRKQDCALLAALMVFTSQPCHADHPAAVFGHGIAGPIVTIPATTLPKGMWTVGARLEFIGFDPFSDQELEAAARAGEEIHSTDQLLSPSLALGYGVTADLTVGARLPYVLRSAIREGHLESGVQEVHDHGDSKGIGDLTILGQYRFVRAPDGFAAALLAGVKLPTGETRARMEVAGNEDENSGGNLIYLSPGVRIGRDGRWSFSSSVGIPVLQDLNGSQHDTDLRVLVGLGLGF